MILDPGQFLLLVRDLPVFENRYGTGLPVVGQYGGALDNAGERLELSDLFGNTIQVLDYEDDWYEIADGDGFSLNVVDAAYDQAAEIVAGAVAHWSFNESSGTTVLDETGNYPGMIFNMQNTNREPPTHGFSADFCPCPKALQ